MSSLYGIIKIHKNNERFQEKLEFRKLHQTNNKKQFQEYYSKIDKILSKTCTNKHLRQIIFDYCLSNVQKLILNH
jgi:hypothetical protein